MVSYPKPDILECKLKWALRSTVVNKASACDEIPAEQFRSLKDNAIKVLHSLCQQIWKTQQWPQHWKMSILIPVPKKGSTKECANHQTVALISHASKVMLKILHASLQHYVNHELPDHLTCLLRNLYVGQKATVRTLYGATSRFKIEKGV